MNEKEKVRNAIKRVIELRSVLQDAKRETRDAVVRQEQCAQELAKSQKDAERCVHAVFGVGEHRLCYGGRMFVFDNPADAGKSCRLDDDYEIEVLTD